jgi:ABC-type glycerol-3-phosphate transport system substrate-binding protein
MMAGAPPSTFGLKVLLLFLAIGSFIGAHYLLKKHDAASPSSSASTPQSTASGPLEIGIAYGTEKRDWLTSAAADFAKTPAGKNVKINLKGMGSLEAAQAILRGDKAAESIHVWCPASSLYRDIFVTDWRAKYGGGAKPIAREEPVALTPMVYVFWDERYAAFTGKYPQVSFTAIGQALAEKGGWDAIAQKPEWGLFKFGHTHPNESNSGLMTLVLMAYDYHHKSAGLNVADIVSVPFQEWLGNFERGVNYRSNSTGNLMREMVLKGPSTYDALFVYESVAIEQLKNAEGRWQGLKIVYPKLNAWNDNPYYVLDAPWSTKEHRAVAEAFLDFLLSEPVQRDALSHGFRPANVKVSIKFAGSPFEQYKDTGLQVDLATVCEPPKAEVMDNLLASWQRSQAGR